jgi:hypothetical protein
MIYDLLYSNITTTTTTQYDSIRVVIFIFSMVFQVFYIFQYDSIALKSKKIFFFKNKNYKIN